MHFYRQLRPLSALTFDLDDTLYDNGPVIRNAEKQSVAFLQEYHPRLNKFQSEDFDRLRKELCEQEPNIYHDVTHWRWRTIHLALTQEGFSDSLSKIGADLAIQNFALWRSRIKVPESTHTILKALRERYLLVAISNGNADPKLFGLDGYFEFFLRAGPDGRAKPYQDMYCLASERLGVSAGKILHVGDDLNTDIAGALRAGFQACWINYQNRCLNRIKSEILLPHIEISRLASLTVLL